ncbi:MAG: hypothetical protein U0R80_10575 [Nocardioidaceae bacterium]
MDDSFAWDAEKVVDKSPNPLSPGTRVFFGGLGTFLIVVPLALWVAGGEVGWGPVAALTPLALVFGFATFKLVTSIPQPDPASRVAKVGAWVDRQAIWLWSCSGVLGGAVYRLMPQHGHASFLMPLLTMAMGSLLWGFAITPRLRSATPWQPPAP